IARLIGNGARASLRTTFPPITAVAWSSFMTGKNPGKHGIFEFTRKGRDSQRELAVNASFREGQAIWDLLGAAGKRVIVHNFPCTYPPAPVNGVLIADFMTPRGRRDFTYPQSILEEIESEFGPYRLHLSQTYTGGGAEAVIDELFDELEYKARVAPYLMERYDWDGFFQYFWGTDRIQHELWHLIDETHPRHDHQESERFRGRVFDYFKRTDEVIGSLVDLAGDESLVCIASDHGFGPAHKYCSFNIWLLEEGFLKLKGDALTRLKKFCFDLGLTPEAAFKMVKRLPLGGLRPARGVSNQAGASKLLGTLFLSFGDVDWERTVAFSKGNYGQIYVNLKGREPFGSVEPERYDSVCDAITDRLRAIVVPETGRPLIGEVFRREQIYNGPRVSDAPDIAFLPADMSYLPLGNADFTSNRFIVDAFGISGCHRMDGILTLTGGPVKKGFDAGVAQIYDVAPTLLYLMGHVVPDDMDGRLLTEVIAEHHLSASAVRYTAGASGTGKSEVEYSDEENAEIIESLKNLGYMG
ncbi:MAG TPA: alkaline phosphatase family protein, partial [Blastocatellia bacterium]|nr:alkaline phosphatase family protein [Blastocatellia bacterium]